MDNRQKFFNETFKALLAVTVGVWLVYLIFLVLAGDGKVCVTDPPELILNILALAAGVLTAPPLVYGLVRLLFWPQSPRNGTTWITAWLVCCGVGVFVAAAIFFALALSQYGCR